MNTKDIKKALILGDVHGDKKFLEEADEAAQKEGADAIIQLGDFGWWPRCAPIKNFVYWALNNLETPCYFIDGNHEDHHRLEQDGEDDVTMLSPKLFHIKRGRKLRIGKYDVLFMGGAFSIDRDARRKADPDGGYFVEEIITEQQLAKALSHDNVDIVMTHDAPLYFSFTRKMSWVPAAQLNREKLERILEKYNPILWYCGHYHSNEKYSGYRYRTNFRIMHANVNREIIHYHDHKEIIASHAILFDFETGDEKTVYIY